MTTTDSSAIVIDQATTITSDLTVGGDIVPNIANGGNLGSLARPFRSLFVSNNTIFLGGVPLSLDASNNLTVNGSRVAGGGGSTLVNGANTVSLESTGALTLPNGSTIGDGEAGSGVPITTARGTILLGNLAECAGGESHFHIMKGGQQAIDLFLGDDSNYVKLPSTGGVEIATQNFNQYSWIFSTDGNLTIPGDIRSEGNINIEINLSDSTLRRWQFGEDGNLTFPDNTVQTTAYTGSTLTTVAKTVGTTPLSLGDLTFTTPLVDGNYGPFTLSNIEFTVQVLTGATIYTITDVLNNATFTRLQVIGTLDSGDLGGEAGESITIDVSELVPTALDLSKSINKLTDGTYTLANGVEGQIMYLVRQTGSVDTNITVQVANARVNGTAYTDYPHYPFSFGSSQNVTMLIFTDSAWQSNNGTWD
jgi:hypothetical protein